MAATPIRGKPLLQFARMMAYGNKTPTPRGSFFLPRHSELESPCLGVCVINASAGQCHGCFRTPAEIQIWPRASMAEKQAVLDELRIRRKAAGLPESPLVAKPDPKS
jgi:uncharacterized protein